MHKLLQVEDHFLITRKGLVVIPLLPLPEDDRHFTPFTERITVLRPDGGQHVYEAFFVIEHFSLIGGGSQWNVVVNIKHATKDDVPIGSRIYVTEDTLERIT